MTSGASFATSSIGAPSASSYRTGASAPSSAISASNQSDEPASLPPQVSLVAPTGTTPSDRTASWSDQPRVATRVGSSSIVVSPYACSIVTGKASASTCEVLSASGASWASVEPVLQPASAEAPSATASTVEGTRRNIRVLLEEGQAYLGQPNLSCGEICKRVFARWACGGSSGTSATGVGPRWPW